MEALKSAFANETTISLIIAVLLLLIGQFLKLWAENSTRRKEANLEYLRQAYSLIEYAGDGRLQHPQITKFEIKSNLQKSFELIQLYGSKKQVLLAREVLEKLSKNEPVDFTLLTTELRDSLRKQLGLEPLDDKWFWYQAIPDQDEGNTQ